jgi:hypothetical protein
MCRWSMADDPLRIIDFRYQFRDALFDLKSCLIRWTEQTARRFELQGRVEAEL